MTYEVRFSKKAQADLVSIYDYIAEQSDPALALAYFERIRDFCLALNRFPESGTPYHHAFPGVRVVGFERRVTVAFRITSQTVTIVRVLYGGRDIRKMLKAK